MANALDDVQVRDTSSDTRTSRDFRQWLERYHWVVALFAYTMITLVVTFPLILHLNDTIIGPDAISDNMWHVWYQWWFRTALATGQDPAYTHLMYALLPSIQLFAPTYLNGLLGWSMQWFTTPVEAYNLLVLLGFVLSGFTMYLLASEFLRNRLACFMAGFLYTFSTWHFWRAAGHLDLASIQWLPLCAWRIIAFYRRPTWMNAVWMGLAIALVPLSSLYLAGYFLVPFMLLFVVGKLITDHAWFLQMRHLLLSGVAGLVTLVVALPPLYSSLHVDPVMQATLNQYAASGTVLYSADLLSYFVPHPANPVLGHGWFVNAIYAHMTSGPTIEQSNFLGYVTLALATSAFLFARNRTRWTYFWLAFSVLALLLSLGPLLHVAGHPNTHQIPLPFYKLLYGWPILSNFRAPTRFAPIVLMPLTLLAGYAVESIHVRFAINLPARVVLSFLSVVAMGASLAENIQFQFPYPSQAIHIPALYAEIGADHSNGLLLDLPVYPRAGDEFFETIHKKPLVSGYPIRASTPMLLSVQNVPYLTFFDEVNSAVAQDPNGPADVGMQDIYPVTVSFKQGLQEQGIRYVVLHHDFPASYAWMRAFLLKQLGTPFYDNRGEGLTAWRLNPEPPDPHVYSFTMGSGWMPGILDVQHHAMREVQQDGQVLIHAPQTASHHMTVTAYADLKPLTMVVTLNGVVVKTVRFSQPYVTQTVDLGTLTLNQGQNVLQIHAVEGCSLPRQFDPSNNDPRCFSFDVLQVTMSGS